MVMAGSSQGRGGRGAPIVYSTQGGRRCRNCGEMAAKCRCRFKVREEIAPSDGKVRVRRETKGRGGKTVTTISGVPLAADALHELAGELKRLCGSGGSSKDGLIEIQGDHCERVIQALTERGYTAIRAGG
jgi:translation initiation factor 1